jgi:probable F420-dependent oxidoreductase
MRVDASLATTPLPEIPEVARRIEALGYDGMYSFDSAHDPFLPLLLAGEHTERATLTTAVAIAFARNPMTLAQVSYDLQVASRGRFVLGLGTQIKPHIEKRFSMPWSKPAERMRELVLAIRAIWASWHEGAPLDFRGEFYRHTLMTPFFNAGPNPYGLPRISLGGVGPRMTEVAGEVADGFIVHPFSTEKFLREHTVPTLQAGLDTSGRTFADFEIAFPLMVIVAENDEERAAGRNAMRPRLAFYGSTPAYQIVLAAHGWGDLQPELNTLSKRGDWKTMSALMTDEIVDRFVVEGTPEEIGPRVRERFGSIVQRVSFDTPTPLTDDQIRRVIASFDRGDPPPQPSNWRE